jgi:hypothetical protein
VAATKVSDKEEDEDEDEMHAEEGSAEIGEVEEEEDEEEDEEKEDEEEDEAGTELEQESDESESDKREELMDSAERLALQEMRREIEQMDQRLDTTDTDDVDFTTVSAPQESYPDTTSAVRVRRRLVVADAMVLMKRSVPYRRKNNLCNIKIADVMQEVSGCMLQLVEGARDKEGRVVLLGQPRHYTPAASPPLNVVRAVMYLLDKYAAPFIVIILIIRNEKTVPSFALQIKVDNNN